MRERGEVSHLLRHCICRDGFGNAMHDVRRDVVGVLEPLGGRTGRHGISLWGHVGLRRAWPGDALVRCAPWRATSPAARARAGRAATPGCRSACWQARSDRVARSAFAPRSIELVLRMPACYNSFGAAPAAGSETSRMRASIDGVTIGASGSWYSRRAAAESAPGEVSRERGSARTPRRAAACRRSRALRCARRWR